MDRDVLARRLREYLPAQRWFGAKDRGLDDVEVVLLEQLRPPWPALFHALVETRADGGERALYQLLVGVRPAGQPAEFLQGSNQAVLGEVELPEGHGFAYDALLDGVLGLALLEVVAPGERATLVRSAGVEQSNTSLVYDDRLILKVFRRVAEGTNLEVEVTSALAEQGFTQVAAPLAVWRHDGRDLAVLQPFLFGAAEGWALALTSLRDLYHSMCDPAEAGGDFAGEAERLGETTARLHVALAVAFGRHRGDPAGWADTMRAQLARTRHPDLDAAAVDAVFGRLAEVADPGPGIRIHGDFHLGQVLRTDAGWYALDFEGEPARPVEERRRPSSPLRDVAGMLRSFDYAARVALREREQVEQDPAHEAVAAEWSARNRAAFLDGYLPAAQAADLVPADTADLLAVLGSFELEKAVYELAYEMAHRPEWTEIPLDAIRRITEAGVVRK